MNKIEVTISKLNNIIDNLKENTHYDLNNIFEDMNRNILQDLMNHYLKLINNIEVDDINAVIRKSDNILSSFDYNYHELKNKNRLNNSSIMEEANIITDDLINKLFDKNNRYINLPINVNNIIDYSISNHIANEDVDKVLYYVIIKLAVIYDLYEW